MKCIYYILIFIFCFIVLCNNRATGLIYTINNVEDFQHELDHNKDMVVLFFDKKCKHSQKLSYSYNSIYKKYYGTNRNSFISPSFRMDIKKLDQTMINKYNIRSIPKIIHFQHKKHHKRFVGNSYSALVEFIKKKV